MASVQTKLAIGFILTSIAILGLVVYLASLNENEWIDIEQSTHPPTVSIVREGQMIMIRWYGGWDESFIDHIQICSSITPCKKYVKPYPGGYIYIPVLTPENVSVQVSGWDLAVQSYRPIANVSV